MQSKNKKRILFVNNVSFFFWSHRVSLAEAAHAAGYDVHVMLPDYESCNSEKAKGSPFTFHYVNVNRSSIGPQELLTIFKLFRLFRQVKPDLVHLIAQKPLVYGAIAAKLAKVPAVLGSVTGLGSLYTVSSIKYRFILSLLRQVMPYFFNSDRVKIVFQNDSDQEIFERNYKLQIHNMHLIPGSGVDCNKFHLMPFEEGCPVIVCPCRLLEDKGIREFIEAAREVKKTYEARFVLVGAIDRGNPTGVPESTVLEWVKEGVVEWWGHNRNMPEVYRKSHIVCLPSYWEGLPKVLIEAAACGRPLVATDIPGCNMVIQGGINGFVVPCKDSAELAKTIEKLLLLREQWEAFGQAGRRIVLNEFTIEKINAMYLELYDIMTNYFECNKLEAAVK